MHKMMLMLLLMAAGPSAFGQFAENEDSIKTRWVVGGRAHYGFVLIHSYALDPVRHSFPWGAEMDIGKQFIGKRAWDFCNCYPRAGASLTFGTTAAKSSDMAPQRCGMWNRSFSQNIDSI